MAVEAYAMARRDDEDEGEGGEAASSLNFVTFMLAHETFAAPLGPVQEIIRVPRMVHVPMAPPSLLGLANLRGRVLPIISLRRVLGLEDESASEQSRALVFDLGQPCAFMVDCVFSVMSFEAERIEPASGMGNGYDASLFQGIAHGQNGALVMILSPEKLLEKAFSGLKDMQASTSRKGSFASRDKVTEDDEADHSDELRLVSFKLGEQNYGAPIHAVREIVQAPETIVELPSAPPHILGLVTLRERLLPLLSLRGILGLPASDAPGQRVLVIENDKGAQLGLLADRVEEVLGIAQSALEEPPPLLNAKAHLLEISGLCRLDNNKRLLSVIKTDGLFENAHSHMQSQATEKEAAVQTHDQADEDAVDDLQWVVFRLGAEEYGVPIHVIQEIVRVPEKLTHVPQAPAFVHGLMNLRGTVLPVVDLRARLGLEARPRTDSQRIMVCLTHGARLGLIVDTVSEVLKLDGHHVEPAPHLSADQADVFSRMLNIEKDNRIILLMQSDRLFTTQELAGFSTV